LVLVFAYHDLHGKAFGFCVMYVDGSRDIAAFQLITIACRTIFCLERGAALRPVLEFIC